MPEKIQTRVGHVLVVGGRAVRVSPPGALAELAPRRAARGREGHAFFTLITPHGELRAPAAYYEELAQLAADIYFGSSGGITSGLREALTAVNQHILARAQGGPVNALALALHGEDLYLARAGRTFVVWYGADGLIFFPQDRSDPLEMALAPLGKTDTPELQLARFVVAPGQTMLLCDESLQYAPTTTFDVILGGANLPVVLERLRALSSQHMAVSAIEFVAPDASPLEEYALPVCARDPRHLPIEPVLAEPLPSEKVSAPPEGHPASQPVAQPPMADVMVEEAPSAEVGLSPAAGQSGAGEPIPAILPPAPVAEETVPLAETPSTAADEQPAGAPAIPTMEEATSSPSAAAGPSLWGRLRGVLGSVVSVALPEDAEDTLSPPAPTTSAVPSALERARQTLALRARQGMRGLLVAALVVVDFLAMVLDRLVPEPEGEKRQGIPTNVAVGLAVMIPVVIVLAAVGMALVGRQKSEFQQYVERARSAHAEAMRLSDGKCDNQALRPLWVEVLRLTELADDLRPNDPNVLIMRADAQNYLDCFDDVVRRDLRLLHTYPRDADMAALVVHGGVDLYALDRRNGVVYHGTLNERGDGLSDSGDQAVIWTGQTISGATGNFTVGRIVDIEWLADGGTRPKNVLVALDANGVLVAYSPTYFSSAQQLVTEGRWQEPLALAVYRSNLYVLDRAANQIWRYVPPAGAESYPNAPEEYFNGEQLPDLTGAVDFGISDDGAVYILFSDGTVRRYRRNVQGIVEEQPFEFRQRPPGAIVSGSALFVDNDPASRNLYVVDPRGETIYETSWAGTFNQGYRPRNLLDAFKDARAFYADAVVRNNMYVLSGNRLYHFYRFQ
ncbi:MAG: hypothetical protein Kow00106_16590 [Anaerolineae bacterium]